MEIKLKQCPFCGGEAQINVSVGHPAYVKIICGNCNVETEAIRESVNYCARDKVAKLWNRRKVNINTDKLWDVHCYQCFDSEDCVWGIRDGLDRRIIELVDKETAEKICEAHNKCFLEEEE